MFVRYEACLIYDYDPTDIQEVPCFNILPCNLSLYGVVNLAKIFSHGEAQTYNEFFPEDSFFFKKVCAWIDLISVVKVLKKDTGM
jgi:hypothetical protein